MSNPARCMFRFLFASAGDATVPTEKSVFEAARAICAANRALKNGTLTVPELTRE